MADQSISTQFPVPSYRMAHDEPDWSGHEDFYDCMTLIISRLSSLILAGNAEQNETSKADPNMLYLAEYELADMRAILDKWFQHQGAK